MRTGILALSLAAGLGLAQAAIAADATTLQDDRSKASYGIGVNIGQNIKRSGMDLNLDLLTAGIKDVLTGGELKMTEEQARTAITAYQQESRRKQGDKNRKEGEAYLAANKAKPDVKSKTITLADGGTADLLYKVIKEGSGNSPASNDTVTVNYVGKLINGTEFDSSIKRGQPAKFQVNRVIRGWTEALQMMKPGAKYELYIPAALAYGDFGSGPLIEPGATLTFEVELLGVDIPQAPAPTAQPLTSDIIKVPSAEELKKGAKVEVLKPEDVERELRAATNKAAAKPETK